MFISVIIPTKDRPELLNNCLKSINIQKKLPNEVLIIDSSFEKSKLALSKYKFKIRLYKTKIKNPSFSRNLGISKLDKRSEVVAFLDDDCVVYSDWIFNINQFFLNSKNMIIRGSSISKTKNLFIKYYANAHHQTIIKKNLIGNNIIHIDSKNFALRTFIAKKNKFDEGIQIGGEDTDYGYNLINKGYFIEFSDKIRCIHNEPNSSFFFFKKRFYKTTNHIKALNKWRFSKIVNFYKTKTKKFNFENKRYCLFLKEIKTENFLNRIMLIAKYVFFKNYYKIISDNKLFPVISGGF